ncbi:MAG: 3D domain-containing protein [Verrucomicrobiota bacterium]
MKSNLTSGLICGTILFSVQNSDAGFFRRDKSSSSTTGLSVAPQKVVSFVRGVIPLSSNRKLSQDNRYRVRPTVIQPQPRQLQPSYSPKSRSRIGSTSLAAVSQPSHSSASPNLDTMRASLSRLRSTLISPPDNLTPVSGNGSRTVRTTAYTHSEADHLQYGRSTAIGTRLKSTRSHTSAAADWSRFPLGTKFRIVGDDTVYVIEDYGSALVGTDTIDIYHPSKSSMNRWGVRHVNIRILEMGCYDDSRKILSGRLSHAHCLQMHRALARFQLADEVRPIQLVRR